ncbi:MAG: peroxiredoxin [Candidatus Micrarchaeia archaeon]
MGKLSIIMFSGTADKFIPLGVLTDAAAAVGTDVEIFVTGFALLGFTKEKHEIPFPSEFKNMENALIEGIKKTNTKNWFDMLKEAKSIGNGSVKIYVCSLMASMFGLEKKDLDPIVDDIVGAATFLTKSEGNQIIFI